MLEQILEEVLLLHFVFVSFFNYHIICVAIGGQGGQQAYVGCLFVWYAGGETSGGHISDVEPPLGSLFFVAFLSFCFHVAITAIICVAIGVQVGQQAYVGCLFFWYAGGETSGAGFGQDDFHEEEFDGDGFGQGRDSDHDIGQGPEGGDGDGQEGAGKGPEGGDQDGQEGAEKESEKGPEGGDRDGQEGADKESGAGGEGKKDAGEGGNIGGNPRILMLEWTKSPCNFFVILFHIFL